MNCRERKVMYAVFDLASADVVFLNFRKSRDGILSAKRTFVVAEFDNGDGSCRLPSCPTLAYFHFYVIQSFLSWSQGVIPFTCKEVLNPLITCSLRNEERPAICSIEYRQLKTYCHG